MFYVPFLTKEEPFPHWSQANEYGLLALGGELTTERLLTAYQNGIFPWYGPGEPISWYFPDPRFVLFPKDFRVNKSFRQALRKSIYNITTNKAFSQVIKACASTPRPGQDGTWLLPEMIEAYIELNRNGFARSIEVWNGTTLAGGLYGVHLGDVFYGESIFTHQNNAGKLALHYLVTQLKPAIIDCQMKTEHMERLGGKFIDGADFAAYVKRYSQTSKS